MAAAWQLRVQPAVEEMMRAHAIPGIVVAVAPDAAPPEHLVLGADGTGQPLAIDSLFPVASLTKLATALAVLRLVDAGRLALDEELGQHVPEAATAQPGVTMRRLLTHTSGVRGDYAQDLAPRTADLTWAAIARASLQVPLHQPPGRRVDYSNLNYSLLAVVIERITGRPFPAALRALVLGPLGPDGYLGGEPPRPPAYIGGIPVDQFTDTPLERVNSAFNRSLGLPAGGLVITAAGSLALVRAFQGQPAGFLSPALLAEARRDQTGGLAGDYGATSAVRYDRCPWGLGPEVKGDKAPFWAPPEASPATFGHYGATGCSAWADPVAGVAWAILGARMLDGLASRTVMSTIGTAILTAAGRHAGTDHSTT